MNNRITRDSTFELIRIISMFFIVVYHLFLQEIEPNTSAQIYKAIQIPLHVGVILFVLLSGYFNIHFKIKGLIVLVATVFVYFVPLNIFSIISSDDFSMKQLVKSIFFISKTPYWFIRTYIFLFLISPVINCYLKNITWVQRKWLLAILGIISIYMGTLLADPSVSDGKNIVNFVLIYVLGDTLARYKSVWQKFSHSGMIILYLGFNIGIVAAYMLFSNQPMLQTAIWLLCFTYCSPFLIANGVLLFIILGKNHIQSKLVNYTASSMFAVYLIHCMPFLYNLVIPDCCRQYILPYSGNPAIEISLVLLLGLIVMICSIAIDKALTPLWNVIAKAAAKIDTKIDYKTVFKS